MTSNLEFFDLIPRYRLEGVIPDGLTVADALLTKQFFPNVKTPGEELPPLWFDSQSFTIDAASALDSVDPVKASHVTFRARRFDGLVRRMGVPHPVPYSRLILHMRDHWDGIANKLVSDVSMVRPMWHKDGRVLHMNYEGTKARMVRETREAQGHRYLVRADVANCFPSIYSHSIDWALRGISEAKRDRSSDSWPVKLDTRIRNCHDGETKGLMIGPAVSNILAELVLQRVDEELLGSPHSYEFVRFVDDYTAYFDSRDIAEGFVADLDRALTRYRLVLSTRKTRVQSLRHHTDETWIEEIHAALPSRPRRGVDAVQFVRHCEGLSRKYPDRSVLRYAIKLLLRKRHCPDLGKPPRKKASLTSDVMLLDELVRLNYFYPHLSFLIVRQLAHVAESLGQADTQRIAKQLSIQMVEAARRFETDTVLWLLYGVSGCLKESLADDALGLLLNMDDDLVWVALASCCANAKSRVASRVRSLDTKAHGTVHEHWLSRYELYRIGLLSETDIDPKDEQNWFNAAIAAGVAFSSLT